MFTKYLICWTVFGVYTFVSIFPVCETSRCQDLMDLHKSAAETFAKDLSNFQQSSFTIPYVMTASGTATSYTSNLNLL